MQCCASAQQNSSRSSGFRMLASQVQGTAKRACAVLRCKERHPNTKYSKAAAKAGAKRNSLEVSGLLSGDGDCAFYRCSPPGAGGDGAGSDGELAEMELAAAMELAAMELAAMELAAMASWR